MSGYSRKSPEDEAGDMIAARSRGGEALEVDGKPLKQYLREIGFRSWMGCLFGYSCGTFAKQMSQRVIWYSGLTSCMLAMLMVKGWISINWSKIGQDFKRLVTRARNEHWFQKVINAILQLLPLFGGFAGAFYYGFKHGA